MAPIQKIPAELLPTSQMITALLAIQLADNANVAQFLGLMMVDPFDDESNVDTLVAIPGATGTPIGDMTGGGGLAAGFNGSNSQANASSPQTASGAGTGGWIGKTFSAARRISKVDVYPTTVDRWFSAADGTFTVTLTLYGKNGTAPASQTDGTVMGTLTAFLEDATSPRTITSTDQVTAYTHVWVGLVSSGSTGTRYISQLVLYDVSLSSNQSYNAATDLYSPATTGGFALTGGTLIGDLTAAGGLAAAFDGNTSQASANTAVRINVTTGYIGKSWIGAAKTVATVQMWPSTDVGFHDGGAPPTAIVLNLRGKNGTAPASAADGTLLGTTGSFTDGPSSKTITSTDTTTAWEHLWVEMVPNAICNLTMGEMVFTSPVVRQNMAVVSKAVAAGAAPTSIGAVFHVKENEAAVAGTDYTLEFSRDDGTSWSTATLTERFTDTAGNRVVEAAMTSVAGQPTGTNLRWRFKTLNNKNVDLVDMCFYWS